METARELLSAGDLDAARVQIDGVLAREPRSVEALLLRSTLRTRQGELREALADAEAAVRLSGGAEESQLRRAISLWRLQEFGQAKCVARWLGDSQAATMWKSMIAARSEPEERVDAVPAEHLPSAKVAERITPVEPAKAAPSVESVKAAPAPEAQNASQPSQPSQPPQPSQPRVDWYQSGSAVYITLYRKGLEKTSTAVRIGEHDLAVASSDFNWTLVLGHSIDAGSSTYEITPYKVEFVLRKRDDVRWGALESSANDAAPPVVAATPTPATSYSKWDKLDADAEDEGAKNSDPNAFFQELYKTATPEVQRAMMKSFVESNGTALSTNWDEVKKGKVETVPPKDMEARKWT